MLKMTIAILRTRYILSYIVSLAYTINNRNKGSIIVKTNNEEHRK